MKQYDATPQSGNQFFRNYDVGFSKQTSTRWKSYSTGGGHLVLTGNTAVVRYYVVNSSGKLICVGDCYLNGGQNMNVPAWYNDGIGKSLKLLESGVRLFANYMGMADTDAEYE